MQSTSWPCIYCRKVSEGRVPRAHVAPECILANEIVLPAGAECAACNSALGTVDRELVKHNRIRGPIMLLAAPGKGRRQRRELGPLRRDPETGDLSTVPVIRDASWTAGELSLQIPGFNELDDLRFRRALHHMAFNYPAHKLGVETVLKPEFDPVRVYVRRPAPSAKWQYAQTLLPDAEPRRELRLTLLDEAPGRTVRFRSYIDDFYVDCLNTGALSDWALTTLPPSTGIP